MLLYSDNNLVLIFSMIKKLTVTIFTNHCKQRLLMLNKTNNFTDEQYFYALYVDTCAMYNENKKKIELPATN